MYSVGSSLIPSTAQAGSHYFNPDFYGGSPANFLIANTQNYNPSGSMTLNLYNYTVESSGNVIRTIPVATYTATQPFRYSTAVAANGNIYDFYQLQNSDGTSSIIQQAYDANYNSLEQTTIASGIHGAFDQNMRVGVRTGTSSSYALAWEAYDSSTQTQDISGASRTGSAWLTSSPV